MEIVLRQMPAFVLNEVPYATEEEAQKAAMIEQAKQLAAEIFYVGMDQNALAEALVEHKLVPQVPVVFEDTQSEKLGSSSLISLGRVCVKENIESNNPVRKLKLSSDQIGLALNQIRYYFEYAKIGGFPKARHYVVLTIETTEAGGYR